MTQRARVTAMNGSSPNIMFSAQTSASWNRYSGVTSETSPFKGCIARCSSSYRQGINADKQPADGGDDKKPPERGEIGRRRGARGSGG